jgi:excisionase family DNA binding protein
MTPEKTDPKSLQARISKAKEIDGGAPLAISTMEAAARLRVGRTTMKRLIRENRVQSKKIGRMRRVLVASLDTYLNEEEEEQKRPHPNKQEKT